MTTNAGAEPNVTEADLNRLHANRWRVTFGVLALDLVVTPLIYVSQTINNAETHRTQASLRNTQIDDLQAQLDNCLQDSARAQAQRAYIAFQLAQQQKGLQQIKLIPGFNTSQITRLAKANAEANIAATQQFLKAYVPTDCHKQFVVPKK